MCAALDVAGSAAGTTPAGCPDGGGCIAVHVNNASTPATYISASTIATGGAAEDVTIRTPQGACQTGSYDIADGTTLQALLASGEIPGIDPATVDHVTVVKPNGAGQITIQRPYVSQDSSGNFYAGQLPILWTNGASQVEFIRTLHADPDPCPDQGEASDNADSNAGDVVLPTNEFAIEVNDGPYLSATISSQPLHPQPEAATRLSASFAATPGVQYRFVWNFGDGRHRATNSPQVQHSFASGTFFVTVNVTGTDNSSGYGSANITTGAAPTPSATTSAPSQATTHPTKASPSPSIESSTPASAASTPSAVPESGLVGATSQATRSTDARPQSRRSGPAITGELLDGHGDRALPKRNQRLTTAANPTSEDSGAKPWPIAAELITLLSLIAVGAGRELLSRRRARR